jgi:hypothetical protein
MVRPIMREALSPGSPGPIASLSGAIASMNRSVSSAMIGSTLAGDGSFSAAGTTRLAIASMRDAISVLSSVSLFSNQA